MQLSSRVFWLWVVVGLCVFGNCAVAATPATLVGLDLLDEPIMVVALRDNVISYFDSQRLLRHEAVEGFVQLRYGPVAGGEDIVELLDGQRLAGQLEVEALREGFFPWRCTASVEGGSSGLVLIHMDEVVGMNRVGYPLLPRNVSENVVRLVNGDQVRGLVLGLGLDGLLMLPTHGPEAITLPLERIAGMRLPGVRLSSRGDQHVAMAKHMLYLTDGSRLRVERLRIESGRVGFSTTLPGQSAQVMVVAIEKVSRIDFTGSGAGLIDLADQPMRLIGGGEVFGLPYPTRLEASSIYLHAPMTLRFDLPDSVSRLALTAELDLDAAVANELSQWADLELIVTHGPDDQKSRFHLHRGKRSIRINVPIGQPTLTIELDAAINGPILDRLHLRDAVLLQQDECRMKNAQ